MPGNRVRKPVDESAKNQDGLVAMLFAKTLTGPRSLIGVIKAHDDKLTALEFFNREIANVVTKAKACEIKHRRALRFRLGAIHLPPWLSV